MYQSQIELLSSYPEARPKMQPAGFSLLFEASLPEALLYDSTLSMLKGGLLEKRNLSIIDPLL